MAVQQLHLLRGVEVESQSSQVTSGQNTRQGNNSILR